MMCLKKEELQENELKDVITQCTAIEQLLIISLEETKFYLERTGVVDANISKQQEMKDVDEGYLKMAIAEKVEDLISMLTPD